MTNQLDRESMLLAIKQRQAKYAANFAGDGWEPDQLSDIGWLGLIGVPWLLYEMENNGQNHGRNRNADSQPGSHSVRSPEPAFQLMLSKQTVAYTALVIPTGNPFAKLLVSFFAKVVGVSFVAHVVERSNAMSRAKPCL